MLQLDVAGRPPGRGAKCCRPTFGTGTRADSERRKLGVPCAGMLPGVARSGRRGGVGRTLRTPAGRRAGERSTGVRVPRPRLHAASRRAPRAKRMNQPRPPFPVLSLKSAGGRAQRRSMLAFREHSPSRPSRPRGAVWLPRDSLRKDSELQSAARVARPATTSPRHRPGGSRAPWL